MKKIFLVILTVFISMPIFAQRNIDWGDTPEEISIQDTLKLAFDILTGVGQFPKGTQFMGKRGEINMYTHYVTHIDDAGILKDTTRTMNFLLKPSGVGGEVIITYEGELFVFVFQRFEMHLFEELFAFDSNNRQTVVRRDAQGDPTYVSVSGRVSPINSTREIKFKLERVERQKYTRLVLTSIGF